MHLFLLTRDLTHPVFETKTVGKIIACERPCCEFGFSNCRGQEEILQSIHLVVDQSLVPTYGNNQGIR